MTTDASQRTLDLKISIIMNEYNTLRDELISKNSNSSQLVGNAGIVAVTAIMAIITAMPHENLADYAALFIWILLVLLLFSMISLVSVLWLNYDTQRVSKRLRCIEEDINRRTGEHLLVWESQYGWGGGFVFKTRKNVDD